MPPKRRAAKQLSTSSAKKPRKSASPRKGKAARKSKGVPAKNLKKPKKAKLPKAPSENLEKKATKKSADAAEEENNISTKRKYISCISPDPLNKLKVVILGQDPYHDDGQAMGLAFSVPKGVPPPPSLKNIYKELKIEYPEFTAPDHGSLERWAEQGVLLLNATLTVEAHQPNSHSKIGWQKFTDAVIKIINNNCRDIAFILWGGFAQKKGKIIDQAKHHVINTAHPSPLSLNKFLNCGCFTQANKALKKAGQSQIDWTDL
ncbi:uracil-DNA glycosylase-like [Ptychodera flava]|uniref:uracil-DNA glycosylase-like n=1 Tax=Ptychodera flava TaxID=63121 RepID=UPI00396AACD8